MRTLMIALSGLALATTTTAIAQTADFVVEHADLDLSNKHDQKTLKSRIVREAREYCGQTKVLTGTRIRDANASRCFAQVTKLANERMATLVEQASKGG